MAADVAVSSFMVSSQRASDIYALAMNDPALTLDAV
jgi:hypothetical protein